MAGIFFIIFACSLWALDALIRYPLVGGGIDPTVIVFLEHALLSLVFLPRLIQGVPRAADLRVGDVVSFLVIGGFGSAFATVCFTQAFTYLNPSLVILLQKFQPVVAITLAALILREPVPKPFLAWGFVSLIGAILISSPDIQNVWRLLQIDPARLGSDAAVQGYSLVGISILGWGAATVFGKKLSMAGFEPTAILTGRFVTGFVTLLFLVPWGPKLILADATNYLRILVMATAGGVALWSYYQGMKRLPAKLVSIAELFFPLMAVVMNWFFLGKSLSEIQLVGGALLVIGAFILQLKKY